MPDEQRAAQDAAGETQEGWLAAASDIQSASALDVPAPIGSWVLDLDERAGQWSPEMFAIFGLDPDTFLPTVTAVFDRAPPEDAALGHDYVEALADGRRGFVEFRFRYRRANGELRLIEVRGWALPDERGLPSRAVGTARDVTELAWNAAERQRLNRRQGMILEAAADAIVGIDAAGRILFCNPALLALTRREGESLIGLRLHDVVHRNGSESHAFDACPLHTPAVAEIRAYDTEFRRADGTVIEVGYSLVSVDEPDLAGSVLSFRDVTARRAASRLLRSSLQEVRELSVQRGELLSALAEAEERERLRLAAELHDDTVQTLDALRLGLERAAAGGDADGAQRAVVVGAEQVRRVADQLRQVMFELMPPDGSRDLTAAVEEYCSVMLGDTTIAWEVRGAPRPLPSDQYLLAYRLIQEAVRNAVKHSEAGRLRVDLELSGRQVVARVSDDGVGMPVEGGPAPTHAGLSIVRHRAEAAGGSVTFGTGIDDRGLSVEIRLPQLGVSP